jgi:hypothetical protein
MRTRLLTLALVLGGTVAFAQAPTPAGTEFRINNFTAGGQSAPAAAGGDGGRFAVVWESDGQDGSGLGIIARRLDATGGPQGGELLVNTYTTGNQNAASIAAGPNSFLVTWQSAGQDGSGSGIFARAFNGGLGPVTGEVQVNTLTAGDQTLPRVAAIPGGYVIVWKSAGAGVRGRVYSLAGQPVSPELTLNVSAGSDVTDPVAAGMPDGGFVVAFRDALHVFVRRFTTSGPTGPESQVDTETWWSYDSRAYTALSTDAAGNIIVGWRRVRGFIGDGFWFEEVGLQARRYDANGTPQGTEFLVDQAPQSWTVEGSFSTGSAPAMLLGWTSSPGQFFCTAGPPPCPPQIAQDGSGKSIYVRWAVGGVPLGNEFRVNTYTTSDQSRPSVATDPHGNVLVVWQSNGQDGSGTGIYAQRLGGLAPIALAVDPAAGVASNGNGVLEPGETATIAPTWRNATSGTQVLTGSVFSFTGPAGPGYSAPDPTATYGAVGPAANVSCATLGDCYQVATSGARPATHWDAELTEVIAPAHLGQSMHWTVHVGASFTDVPVSSPYYRFVETLLHKAVTGGCTSTAYCPTATTTRAQMPVFVLVARQGIGYVPPACTTPMFGDVPASDPFCRWIEEAVRRGAVADCGGGNYCPNNPMTREAMSLFMLKILDPALNPPACTTPLFADVPASNPFCRWIEELARRGVVTGCGGGNYCPTNPVTREQMAVFISVTFGLTLYAQ